MESSEGLPPTILVIFGITGDLSQRKLLPALSVVAKNGQLPAQFKLLGITRRSITAKQALGQKNSKLAAHTTIFKMDLAAQSDYQKLAAELKSMNKTFPKNAKIIFYLALPPTAVLPVIRHLGKAGLNHDDTRLLLEKPFGVDLISASELIAETTKYFKEKQVYRIDHYLAKEMAQNLAVFLGGNVLFRGAWNNKYIEKIEIFAAEKLDIEGRVSFYEQAGALRDLVQSHLLQLAALVLMETAPDVFDFSKLPLRRLAALKDLKLHDEANFHSCTLRAQYEGYRREVSNPHSNTETFVYLKLKSQNPRWKNVPIYLITGKSLNTKYTEVRVYFRKLKDDEANLLTLRIQPMEAIELDLWIKKPGYEHELQRLPLQFSYAQHFGAHLPDAYEQVLIDAMRARANLFASSAEVLASWAILDPILKRWAMSSDDLIIYKKGSQVEEVLAAGAV